MLRQRIHHLIGDLFDLRDSLLPRGCLSAGRAHFRSSRREALLGIRAIVDDALDRLEKEEAEESSVRVPVES